MELNLQILADKIEDAGLYDLSRQNPIYDFNKNSRSHKIASVALQKLKPGRYVWFNDLMSHMNAQLPDCTNKQITNVLYKMQGIVRYDGLWRRL